MEDLAQAAIEAALKIGASFADVRIENTTTTIIEINDAITKQSVASRMKGAGIRAFIDGPGPRARARWCSFPGSRCPGSRPHPGAEQQDHAADCASGSEKPDSPFQMAGCVPPAGHGP